MGVMWNLLGSEDGNVNLIWKGDKDKGVVYVRMKVGSGEESRRYVFEGELKFKEIEEFDVNSGRRDDE